MRKIFIPLMFVSSALSLAQDPPVAIAANELPKAAVCAVCREGEEKVAAGFRYMDRTFYFCNTTEAKSFKSDPASFLLPRPAPTVSFKTLSGAKTTLAELTGGKNWVLLDFWATWCKPCVDAMPGLEKLHQELSAKGLVIVGASINEEGAAKVKPFLEKRKLSYTMLLDSGEKPAWETFGVKGIPAIFLIDPKGQIVRQWSGKPDEKKLAAEVRELVAG